MKRAVICSVAALFVMGALGQAESAKPAAGITKPVAGAVKPGPSPIKPIPPLSKGGKPVFVWKIVSGTKSLVSFSTPSQCNGVEVEGLLVVYGIDKFPIGAPTGDVTLELYCGEQVLDQCTVGVQNAPFAANCRVHKPADKGTGALSCRAKAEGAKPRTYGYTCYTP